MYSARDLKLMVKEVFDAIAEGYYHVRSRPWSIVYKLTDCRAVADLGCGTGTQLLPLISREGAYGLCIDISNSMLSKARTRFSRSGLADRVDVIQADIEFLPLRSSSIECILSIATLHHLPTQSRINAVKEIERTLRDSGKALITVWSLYQPRFLLLLIPNIFRYLLGLVSSPKDFFIPWRYRGKKYLRYYHLFTGNELRKLIERAASRLRVVEYGVYNLKKTFFHQNYYVLIVKTLSSDTENEMS